MAALAITPAEVSAGAGKKTISKSARLAGERIDAGETVYLEPASKTYFLGDANGATSAKVKGMALNGADIGQPVDIQSEGEYVVGATAAIVVGTAYWQHPTPGKIGPEADVLSNDFKTFIGVGAANNRILLDIFVSEQEVP